MWIPLDSDEKHGFFKSVVARKAAVNNREIPAIMILVLKADCTHNGHKDEYLNMRAVHNVDILTIGRFGVYATVFSFVSDSAATWTSQVPRISCETRIGAKLLEFHSGTTGVDRQN